MSDSKVPHRAGKLLVVARTPVAAVGQLMCNRLPKIVGGGGGGRGRGVADQASRSGKGLQKDPRCKFNGLGLVSKQRTMNHAYSSDCTSRGLKK